MRKALVISIIYFIFGYSVHAQNGMSGYSFLRFPYSVRAAALGETNVSIVENDLSLIYQNPAFLGQEMDMNLNLNYMFYIADINVGSATFAKSLGTRSTWGIGINYLNYGKMPGAEPENILTDPLTANNICLNGFFSRDLSDKIRGGVTAKFIYSNFDQYTAIGLAVDLGVSYYDPEKQFSAGLVVKNAGREVKSFTNEYTPIPWDIQVGISKKLAHAPIRFSINSAYLSEWDFYSMNGEKDNFWTAFSKHFILGVDFIPSQNFWLGVGYNIKTGADMNLQDGNKMGGFSAGAGVHVNAFNIGCSVGRYHPSATSFMVSITTSFSELKL